VLGPSVAGGVWALVCVWPDGAGIAGGVESRAAAYVEKWGVRLVWLLVVRAVPVPTAKSRYIVRDTAREANRLGIPFGRVSDPVGTPVERGYAVLNWAVEQGRGIEFARSFLRHVWSEGVDAGSDRGLKRIVQASGLNWSDAHAQLGTDDWRDVAEANRAEMMSYGVWGVPSFRVGETAVWGQDRLWVVEDALKETL